MTQNLTVNRQNDSLIPFVLIIPDASVAWYKVRKSIKLGKDHYVVAVSWWDERSGLQKKKNGPLAEKRSESTEQKLS